MPKVTPPMVAASGLALAPVEPTPKAKPPGGLPPPPHDCPRSISAAEGPRLSLGLDWEALLSSRPAATAARTLRPAAEGNPLPLGLKPPFASCGLPGPSARPPARPAPPPRPPSPANRSSSPVRSSRSLPSAPASVPPPDARPPAAPSSAPAGPPGPSSASRPLCVRGDAVPCAPRPARPAPPPLPQLRPGRAPGAANGPAPPPGAPRAPARRPPPGRAGAMGAAEPLRSVLWVKRQRCTVSLDPARALLRWWPSPGPGASVPAAGKCRRRPEAPRAAPGREEGARGGGQEGRGDEEGPTRGGGVSATAGRARRVCSLRGQGDKEGAGRPRAPVGWNPGGRAAAGRGPRPPLTSTHRCRGTRAPSPRGCPPGPRGRGHALSLRVNRAADAGVYEALPREAALWWRKGL